MPAPVTEGNSLLAVEVGTITTRAAYFDVVEGQYRFISMGQAPTTAGVPLRNLTYGIQAAIEDLQSLIGKPLLDENGLLLVPSQEDGSGVDALAVTLSVGAPIKTVVFGLLQDVSLKSAENLAQTSYTRIVDVVGMQDQRRTEELLDSFLKQSPEMVIVAGGTNGGSTQTINKVLDFLGLACFIQPEEKRPFMLYAGNQAIEKTVRDSLKGLMRTVAVAPNVRPLPEIENLAPAQMQLAHLVANIREQQMPELEEIRLIAGGVLLPSVYARGRIIQYLGRSFKANRGVLSVDIGASSTSVIASFPGELYLNVFTQFGLGDSLANLLRYASLDDVIRWIPNNLPNDRVRDYIYQKALHPSYIPVTADELSIEQALVRHHLQAAVRKSQARLPAKYRKRNNLLPSMEFIIASGAALTHAPSAGQKLLMLLDGLQPTGTTSLVMDQYNLLAMLGIAAEQNTLLPVQVVEQILIADPTAYLATVVSLESNSSYGTAIVRAKLTRSDGSGIENEVKMGNLLVLPLASGETGQLQLQPLQKVDVGMGPGKVAVLDVQGGVLGVVIDARGRPMRLPADHDRRRELLTLWKNKMGTS